MKLRGEVTSIVRAGKSGSPHRVVTIQLFRGGEMTLHLEFEQQAAAYSIGRIVDIDVEPLRERGARR